MDKDKAVIGGGVKHNPFKQIINGSVSPRKVLVVSLLVFAVMAGAAIIVVHFSHKPLKLTIGGKQLNPTNSKDRNELIASSEKTDVSAMSDIQKVIHYSSVAGLYLEAKNYSAALDNYKKAEQVDPHEPQTLINIGQVLVLMNQRQQAREYYAKALAEYQKITPVTSELKDKINQVKALINQP